MDEKLELGRERKNIVAGACVNVGGEWGRKR